MNLTTDIICVKGWVEEHLKKLISSVANTPQLVDNNPPGVKVSGILIEFLEV
jgi:hypothetical protein